MRKIAILLCFVVILLVGCDFPNKDGKPAPTVPKIEFPTFAPMPTIKEIEIPPISDLFDEDWEDEKSE